MLNQLTGVGFPYADTSHGLKRADIETVVTIVIGQTGRGSIITCAITNLGKLRIREAALDLLFEQKHIAADYGIVRVQVGERMTAEPEQPCLTFPINRFARRE